MKKEASFDDWNDVDDFLLVMNERYIKVLHMSGEIIYKTCPFCEILDASNLGSNSEFLFEMWSRGAKHHRQRHSGCPVLHQLLGISLYEQDYVPAIF